MTPRARSSRVGLTLVELLATIAIIGLLVALLLPAVQSARESARRMSCSSKLRELGNALSGFTASRGAFPGSSSGCYYCPSNPSGGSNLPQFVAVEQELRTATGGMANSAWNWLTQLLPYMDQQNLYDRLDFNQLAYSPAMQAVGRTLLPALICPSDTRGSSPLFGGLSTRTPQTMMPSWYVGSAGPVETNCYYPNVNNSPTRTNSPYCDVANRPWCAQPVSGDPSRPAPALTSVSGVFAGNFRGLPVAKVADGLSNTIALGETLPYPWRLYNWILTGPTATLNIPFNMPFSDKLTGDLGGYNYTIPNTNGIHWTLCETQGIRSEHPMAVNVAFCDGSVRTLAASIDYRVQCALATIRGSAQPFVWKATTWSDAVMVSDSDFR
jgi:prepilin-type processing-associated H-X9-DG protein